MWQRRNKLSDIWSADVEARFRSDFRISCVTPDSPWLVVEVPNKDDQSEDEDDGDQGDEEEEEEDVF